MYRFIYIYLLISFCFISVWFAGLSNRYWFNYVSWSVFKYYCAQSIDVDVDYWSDTFITFENNIKFNNSFLSLTHMDISSTFPNNKTANVNNNLYFAEWMADNWQTTDVTTNTFSIVTLNTDNITTELEFVTRDLMSPTYWQSVTAGQLNLRDPAWTYDTLVWVDNATYGFEMCPCTLDNEGPLAVTDTFFPSEIDHWHLVGVYTSTVLFVDDWWSSWWHWYGGNDITRANYTDVGLPAWMDNQEWVDASTLSVTIDYSDGYGVLSDFFGSTLLSPIEYTWTISWVPTITWNNNDRGYWISFQNTIPYAVEQPVTITITGYDNALVGNAPCIRNAKLWTSSYTFNLAEVPVIGDIYPAHNSFSVNPDISQIKFSVTDSWAGVDTWKVWLTIPSIENASGVVVMSGHTYSASDMVFSWINGTSWLGNSGGYDVTLNVDASQKPFLVDAKIYFTGVVVDLAGYTWYINSWDWYIETRKPCSYFGCNEMLNINIIGWLFDWIYEFTGEFLIATWTNPNSPYPYLTWDNWDMLMCGVWWTWSALEGNVDIVDPSWNSIKNDIYTDNVLYIVWLDYTYDPSTGIITVNE